MPIAYHLGIYHHGATISAGFWERHMSLISRRGALTAALGLGALLALPALALSTKFTPTVLADAQKAGKAVLVEVGAPWCPTCKAQQPILGKLLGSDKFKSFVKLDIDFDSQKADLKALNVQQQSTLIVYKGAKEMGRSTGDTNPASIEALLAKAL
jgi:thioredoxin 1